jgi:hypothetical protein
MRVGLVSFTGQVSAADHAHAHAVKGRRGPVQHLAVRNTPKLLLAGTAL